MSTEFVFSQMKRYGFRSLRLIIIDMTFMGMNIITKFEVHMRLIVNVVPSDEKPQTEWDTYCWCGRECIKLKYGKMN
eukprot:11766593-Ditylum_brightwellii.AAC.1